MSPLKWYKWDTLIDLHLSEDGQALSCVYIMLLLTSPPLRALSLVQRYIQLQERESVILLITDLKEVKNMFQEW